MMHRPQFTSTLLTSLIAIGLAAIALLLTLPSLFGAVLRSGAVDEDPSQLIAKHLAEHEEKMQQYQDRFNGRYLFFKPPPPPPKIQPRPAEPEPEPEREPEPRPVEPPKPKAPATYPGPPIVAILGDSVWFQNRDVREPTMSIRVGEERNGVRVVSTDPPRTATIATMGGEYDVPLFPNLNWSMPYFTTASNESRSAFPGLIEVPDAPASADSELPGGVATDPADATAVTGPPAPDAMPESAPDHEQSEHERGRVGRAARDGASAEEGDNEAAREQAEESRAARRPEPK